MLKFFLVATVVAVLFGLFLSLSIIKADNSRLF